MNARFREVDGLRLRRLREERAYSIRELASLSGVSADAINKLELGRRGAQPRTLRRLAEALEVEPVELMKGGGDG